MGGVPARALWGALLLTIVGEFAVCAVLERGVPGYDPRLQAMSALGAGDSPVRLWYRAWLVWLGPAFAVAFSQVRIDRMICRKSTLRSRG